MRLVMMLVMILGERTREGRKGKWKENHYPSTSTRKKENLYPSTSIRKKENHYPSTSIRSNLIAAST